LAQIALHQNDAGAAESSARAAADQFKTASRPDDEASALAVLARSYLLRGKPADSAQAIKSAEELAVKSNDLSVRLAVAITGASILAARGDAAKSLRDLPQIISQARSAGLIRLELEARLALAEIEIDAGRLETGRQRLESLEREAASRGYKYIVDRAAAARKRLTQRTA
jgi:ATP/maltotriose-dependent transcriptional regulator MalT